MSREAVAFVASLTFWYCVAHALGLV